MTTREEIIFLKEKGYLKYPQIVQIEITKKCPLNCPQCYKDLEGRQDMDFEFLSDFIKREAPKGLKSVMINGGEPLVYPHFEEMLRLLAQNNVKANVFSSGVNLTDSIMKCIKETNTFINISLNGSTDEINRTSRDGYEIAMRAIRKLEENQVVYGLNWVARHDNVDDFSSMVKLAEEHHAANILIVGNKKTHLGVLQEPLTTEDYIYLKEYIEKHNGSNKNVDIFVQRCFTSLNTLLVPKATARVSKGCPAGIICCSMTVDGLFMPCTHVSYCEEYSSVSEYWNCSEILQKFRQFEKKDGKCVQCNLKDNCQFCRAVTKENYEDFSKGLAQCEVYDIIGCK